MGTVVDLLACRISVPSDQPNWSGGRIALIQASFTNQVTASNLSPQNHLITLPLSDSMNAVKGRINDCCGLLSHFPRWKVMIGGLMVIFLE
jgi:hypothetical protein